MQGRKPKPTALKELAGNPGKRALNHAEPRPKTTMPRPPEHLSDEEKAKWKVLVRELHALGLVTKLDVDALAMYCVIFVRWMKAEKLVREKGEIIKTTAGNIIQNPYLSIANRALEQLNKLGAEFGMTPSSRSRVKADLTDPDQELERMVLSKKINHGNNPVLTWMADNLVARVDPAGNIKPDKEKSREKIDGIVVLIMAIDLALRHPETKSVYEKRGIRILG